MAGEPFCTSCGTILQPNVVKCPSCGAPQGAVTAKPRMGFSKSNTAGLLLLMLFVLSLVQGIWVLADPEVATDQPLLLSMGDFEVRGNVTDDAGTALGGVNVTVVGRENLSVVSAPDGSYMLEQVPSGVLEIRFESADRPPTSVRVFLLMDETVDAQLGPAGAEPRVVDHPSFAAVRAGVVIRGVVVLLMGVVALLGAIAAYRRRPWGLALAGSICGVFVLPPVSWVLAALAIVFVASGKKEFARKP